jgi:hypothetical protein
MEATLEAQADADLAIAQRDMLAEALRECADAINATVPEDFSRISNAADRANDLLASIERK